MPVAMLVIVPTSRGVSCGVNASRTWLYSTKRTVEDTSAGFRGPYSLALRLAWFFGLGSAFVPILRSRGFGFRLGSDWLGFRLSGINLFLSLSPSPFSLFPLFSSARLSFPVHVVTLCFGLSFSFSSSATPFSSDTR